MNRFFLPSSLLFVLTACNPPAPQMAPAKTKPATQATPAAAAAAAATNCEVGQQISLKISSTAIEGQGCQQGGGKAQKDSVHIFKVIATADGQKGLRQTFPDSSNADKVMNNLKLVNTAQGCQLTGDVEMHMDMPIDENTQGQAQFTYSYDASVSVTGITGTGQVNYKFINKDGTVIKPDCAEPLQISGAS